jgi:hypothetical protein
VALAAGRSANHADQGENILNQHHRPRSSPAKFSLSENFVRGNAPAAYWVTLFSHQKFGSAETLRRRIG